MKRMFQRKKKAIDEWENYEENSYDWDEISYEDSGETEEHYAEEDYAEEVGEYYAEEDYAEEVGEYYAEEDYAEEVGEYYAEEDYAEEVGEYYAEEGYAEEVGEYHAEEDDWRQARAVSRSGRRNGSHGNIAVSLWNKFMKMAVMDRVITVTGVVVCILVLVTGGLYVSTMAEKKWVSVLADVGTQLEGIELIGEKGLMAVADAEIAKQAAADLIQEEQDDADYNETEYSKLVTVKLSTTSVMKDLKIKFTNKDTGKLVGNVPFSVTVTKPDGKSETWSDEDMDGIIYKKNIAEGTYKVLMNELTEKKYENYVLPAASQSVEVKKEIAYEKIDVSNEVKTEDEIDVSKEDTKKNETEVESTLQDTVKWVESTEVAETYVEVSKNTIPDPATLALTQHFVRTSGITADTTVSGGDAELQEIKAEFTKQITALTVGGTATTQVQIAQATQGRELTYHIVSEDTKVAVVAYDGTNITITGVGEGVVNIAAYINYKDNKSDKTQGKIVMPIKVTNSVVIALDKTAATVYMEETETVNVLLTPATAAGTITAESSDTKVATVAVKEKTVTITPVAVGDAVITVKYMENGQETKATCAVKVKTNPKANKTDKLKDSSGQQLYVQENGGYREAVYADYYTASQFFIKGEVKYTGWQTIDGHLYYFTADGKKVTGEQVIQGAKYNFASDGTLITGSGTMGIDVSKWNGKIDWEAVKNSGVSYVIIRCGYRGSSQGMLVEDPKFTANIKGATAAGLKVGVYFFTQATDEIEAVEEASYVLEKIKNYRISYPVFLDVEPSGGRGDKIDKDTRTAVCRAFCETIQRAGYTAGIYANKTWLNSKMDASKLSAYKIWLAQYAATPTYTGRYDMWQYTSKGKVSGISGDVDLNLSYLGY